VTARATCTVARAGLAGREDSRDSRIDLSAGLRRGRVVMLMPEPVESSIIAVERIMPMGLAMPGPAMSRAEPCEGWNSARTSPISPERETPRPPTMAAPKLAGVPGPGTRPDEEDMMPVHARDLRRGRHDRRWHPHKTRHVHLRRPRHPLRRQHTEHQRNLQHHHFALTAPFGHAGRLERPNAPPPGAGPSGSRVPVGSACTLWVRKLYRRMRPGHIRGSGRRAGPASSSGTATPSSPAPSTRSLLARARRFPVRARPIRFALRIRGYLLYSASNGDGRCARK